MSEELPNARHFTGHSEDEIWQQVATDLFKDPDLLTYQAVIQQEGHAVVLDIDIDLGGGFDSGSAITRLTASFPNPSEFRFALHHESFLDELGKFLGMQDIEIGDAEFDQNVVIKSNDEARVRNLLRHLLSDQEVRETLQQLTDFTFEITAQETPDANSNLQLSIYQGITDPLALRSLYQLVFRTLTALASNS